MKPTCRQIGTKGNENVIHRITTLSFPDLIGESRKMMEKCIDCPVKPDNDTLHQYVRGIFG